MKYRLTDSAREDVICCAEGEIDDEFVKHAKAIGRNWINLTHTVYICDIVEIPEGNVPPAYNPCGWNKYPDVTPPEGILMKAEFYWKEDDDEPCRSCWVFKGGKWYWMDGRDCPVDSGWKNIRFRPWED